MKKKIFNFQFSIFNFRMIALLFMGSAFLLVGWGCKGEGNNGGDIENPEAIVTQQSINHTSIQSLNGVRQSMMTAPLIERHDMAREPFIEFPNGIEITTYDSVGNVESTIKANYAINYEKRDAWEARGNVVGHNATEERTLRTEQLFWDRKTGRIYSNVNSYVEQPDGIHFGQGFESDEDFRHWEFRDYRGRMNFDPDALENSDTTAVEPVAPAVTPATVTSSTTATPKPAPVVAQPQTQSRPATTNKSQPARQESRDLREKLQRR